MSSLFGSGTPVTPPSLWLTVQTSVIGIPRPIVWGTTRISGNLIWYGDFYAVDAATANGSGKGGIFSPSSNGSYNYYASVIIALCEGPIASLNTGLVYVSKAIATLGYLDMSYYPGSSSQTGWGFLTSIGEDLSYRYTANVIGNLNLGGSSELPNYGFVVSGAISAIDGYDADVTLMLADFLTNVNYGVSGWTAGLLGDWTSAQDYLLATGISISYALVNQTSASQLMSDILLSCNVMPVWSDAVLKLVPLGDQAVTGSGITWYPPTQPIYDLDDGDFLTNQAPFGNTNADPVSGQRTSPREQDNIIQVGYIDRNNNFNPSTLTAQDDGAVALFGARQSMGVQSWVWFQSTAVASIAAQLALGRQKILNKYSFTLRPRYILLDPGDIVALTDARLGLYQQWVRITDVQENADRTLNFLADEYLQGTGAAPVYGHQTSAGSVPNYAVEPGSIHTPIMFEPTDELAGGLAVWVAVAGLNPATYGGCQAYASYDGVNYSMVPNGRIIGSARMGALSNTFASVTPNIAGQTIDTFNTLQVNLTESAGELLSGSQADALALNTRSWVNGEVISYETATLTGTDQYTLSYLVRGAYGTTIAAQVTGAPFVRLDTSVLQIPFDQTRIGATLYLKFLPFNIWGATVDSLAGCAPYTYVIQGTALASPLPNVQNIRTAFQSGFQTIYWDDITDFRSGIRYLVKKGPSYASSQTLADVAHPGVIVFGDGTYWVTAYCQPVAGLTVYSENPVSITIAGSMLTENVLVSTDFQATAWAGSFSTYLVKQGTDPTAVLRLSGASNILTDPNVLADADVLSGAGVALSGSWTSSTVFNAGYVANCSVNVSWTSTGQPIDANILNLTDILNDPDFLDAVSAAYVSVWPQIRTATTETLGVPNWGSWQNYVPGLYNAQWIQFQVLFTSQSSQIIAYLTAMTALISLPARIDHYIGNNVTTSGMTITFQPDNAAAAAPFNGGPMSAGVNHSLPAINMTWPGNGGFNYVIDSLSLSAITFHFVNSAGTTVAVNGVNVTVEGY